MDTLEDAKNSSVFRQLASFCVMEYLPTVHETTGEPTGIILPRSEAIAEKKWCMSTNVFVVNSHGQILCHQRSLKKERYPGVWSTHLGGHVCSDETFESNAQKELHEEAGIKVESSRLIPWRTTRLSHARLWVKEFVTYLDLPVEAFTPQEGEVEKFAWMNPEEILESKRLDHTKWLAGTHDFATEYHCLRAVLSSAHALGKIDINPDLTKWAL